MTISEQEMIQYVTALARAKSNQDIAGALSIYHPEVELITPAFSAHGRGRDEVDRQLRYFFRLFPDYEIEVTHFVKRDNALRVDGVVKVTPDTANGTAQTATVPVSMKFEFADDAIRKEVFNINLALLVQRAGISLNDLLSS